MPAKREKINVVTLGCSKNLVDSEVLMKQLQLNDWELMDSIEDCDAVVINTCGFIEAAKQESIDTILDATELKNQGKLKKIIVMGCLSERYANELREEIPEVDAFIGANKMDRVVLELGGDLKRELLGERLLTTPRHYAYLKISEGCDRPCSFCSIPLMRGEHVSKPMDRVLAEANRLAALGVKELILIAQDSTYYGLDLCGKRMLASLLEKLRAVDGIEWIRLMYTFPTGFPMDVLDQFSTNPKLCHYLDIPFQHISDSVLTSMRRGITKAAIIGLIERFKTVIPDIALRTTLIVGYPNEGEKEFQELVDFVQTVEFDRLGVFTYSQEEGTAAYDLGDSIPFEVKEEHQRIIMEAQQGISLRKNRRRVRATARILIDGTDGSTAVGRTERDAPEVDNEVTINDAGDCATGTFRDVVIVDAEAYDLYAVPIEKHHAARLAVGYPLP